MTQWIIFAVGSVAITAISWKSLLKPGSHGFYRFFAWEAILGSFTVNMKFWFYQPFAWNQIVAWLLLIVSLIPLALGVHSLRTRGRPIQQREADPSLLAFEKTTQLVTSGIYHYIRHPLYSSLFFLTWGIFFKSISWQTLALACISMLFLVLTAKADEAECTQFFGNQYSEYIKHTKMFVPFVY